MFKKILKLIIIALMIILSFLIFVLLYIQEPCFFHPWHDNESYQILKTINEFEEVTLKYKENTLKG